jgi:hypothetical protein
MDTNRQENGVSVAQGGTESGTERAQKRGRKTEAQRTEELAASLPEQITIGQWNDGRRKPFFLRYGPRDARRMESFIAEQERNDAAEKLAGARNQEGAAVLHFDPQEWREWKDFRKRCPAPLHELESLWRHHGAKDVMLIKDAVPRYMALRESEDVKVGSDTHRHMDLHMRRLSESFGALRLNQVTADLIREHLAKLKARDHKSPASNDTKRDHRKNWNTFFERAVAEEWCDRNPVTKVKPPKILAAEKIPLKPREIFELLKHNANEPIIGRIALELFGFLRAASADRLKREHIKFDKRGIRMPGAVENEAGELVNNHKSGATKFRQGHPPVLWAWLEHVSDKAWEPVAKYSMEKSKAFLRARVTNPGNVLRDSAISYHLAAFKNPPLTSYLAQHKKMSQTETYEGTADESDARLVMAMTPKAVRMTWEKFVRMSYPRS